MADTSQRISGTVFFSINGVAYSMRGRIGYSAANAERTTIIDANGDQFYDEKPVAGGMWGDFTDVDGVTMAAINAMTNESMTAELANGKTIIGSSMRQVGKVDVDVDTATSSIRFEGTVYES